ncbi:hypothetical protein [Pseudomonas serbica]|jgi:hypothetical protein|uniref:hypothetical protein n=1 Tax=Pseudomonas serbica TaxID=2965074 RepID=UPI00237BDFB7|nr:hypothetical protein [Pseudomonas serbica]
MNFLIKKGHGPNHGIVFSMLNDLGADHRLIIAKAPENFLEGVTDERYNIMDINTKKLGVAVFSIEAYTGDQTSIQKLSELSAKLLTERTLGDYTVPKDVILIVMADEATFPELYDERRVVEEFKAKLLDFSCGHHVKMRELLEPELKVLLSSKSPAPSRQRVEDDSPSP